MRDIVQIAAVATEAEPKAVYALCNDHTVWLAQGRGSEWKQLLPIPQPPRVNPDHPCVSCKHYEAHNKGDMAVAAPPQRCTRPQAPRVDPISGQLSNTIALCKDERAPPGGCGPEGRFWARP